MENRLNEYKEGSNITVTQEQEDLLKSKRRINERLA